MYTQSPITVSTPAKVNLFFELLGKRPDGYHEVETVVSPIDFYDTIRVEAIDPADAGADGIALSCDCSSIAGLQPDPMDVPNNERNLVYKAAKLLRERFGVKQGVSIELKKQIPPQSGLGGGSGNAAGAIRACAGVWGLELTLEDEFSLGAELGSDVPMFFVDGASVATGRGEIIEPKPVGASLPIVVIRPPTGISTPEVYRRCRVPQTPRSAEGILRAMTSGDWQTFNKLVFNRLEEFAAQITPWVNKCRNDVMQSGAAGGCLCGSGSCYFGIYESGADADKAAEELKSQGWKLVVRSKLLM